MLVGNAKITVPWVKGLTYEFNYSNNLYTRRYNRFYPSTVPEGSGNKGQAIKNPSEERNWIYNNIVTYLRTFGNHQVNATLLYSQEGRNAESSTLNAQGFDNPVLGYNNVGLGTTVTVGSSAWKENSISYMARTELFIYEPLSVDSNNPKRWLLRIWPEQKFANFPSVSLGWVVSDESFMKIFHGFILSLEHHTERMVTRESDVIQASRG